MDHKDISSFILFLLLFLVSLYKHLTADFSPSSFPWTGVMFITGVGLVVMLVYAAPPAIAKYMLWKGKQQSNKNDQAR